MRKNMKTKIGYIFFFACVVVFLFSLSTNGSAGVVRLDAPGKSPLIKRVRVIHQHGARPRFSPDGQFIIFDRKNRDGFADLYISDLNGGNIRPLTERKKAVVQRNNGNGIFHPLGRFIVFISETEHQFQKHVKSLGDPGLGLYCNLWACDIEGKDFWQLTNIPIKKSLQDKTPVVGIVNPHFSHDGQRLVWTERYDRGGHHNWGKWRVKIADFVITDKRPMLQNIRELLCAEAFGPACNYVTAMAFFPEDQQLLVAGNLDGQHEYGMDLYVFSLNTGKCVNLLHSPETWEEGSAISPDGKYLVYMSNVTSSNKLDFNDPKWTMQPREREYWIMRADGSRKERLTHFNDKAAPESVGRRTIVAALDFSPDGQYLVGTLGVDFGTDEKASLELKVVLIEIDTDCFIKKQKMDKE